jgi:hypothetical protein
MINTQGIYNLLRPGLKAVIGLYETYPALWKELFETDYSDRAFEFEDEIKALGPATEKLEGMSIGQDSMAVKYQTMFKHKTYGTSFSITDEAMEDNQYKKLFPKQLTALSQSLQVTKDQVSANIFNLGTITPVADGAMLFSNLHPIDDGSDNSNMSNVALSEIGIQNAISQISRFKQLSGIPALVKPVKLVTSTDNWVAAGIILGSQFRTSVGSVNNNTYAGVNDINMVNHNNCFPKGYTLNPFITSPTASYIITDAERGLIHYEREKIKQWSWVDNTTKSIWFAAKERYCFGVSNWRGVYQIGA